MRKKNYCLECFNKKCGTSFRKKDIMFDGRLMRCDGCGKLTEETVFCVRERDDYITTYQIVGWPLFYPLYILDWVLNRITDLLLLPYRLYLRKKEKREKEEIDWYE